ncbi:MAG: EVE domain-containing protein [Acidobacteria bacterium]|nr:MAG: EVE domain-containing protein [Acidobacteriota bacterium]
MPNFWLVKTEPSVYSFADLEREGRAVWDGVTNNLAQKNLRRFQARDQVLVYHTGDEKQVVGIATVLAGPYPDPQNTALVVVDLKPDRPLPRPVSLAEIKSEARFSDSPLVRLPRLSVMPVTPEQWEVVLEMSGRVPTAP